MGFFKYLQRRAYDVLSVNYCCFFIIVALLCVGNFAIIVSLELFNGLSPISSSSCPNGLAFNILKHWQSVPEYCDNIGNINVKQFMAYGPIDVVYTWVNGSDEIWLKKKQQWQKTYGLLPINDYTNHSNDIQNSTDDRSSSNRYRDNDELKYSLRSLERFAPWIRHIYLVADDQIPNWLDLKSKKMTVITHSDLFSNISHLPVFSSPAIETHIHKIKGLSNKFIYFNDDVFLGSNLLPEDFVSPSGVQIFYQSWDVPKCSSGCSDNWIGDGFCDKSCNVTACEFDGGDCLNSTILDRYSFNSRPFKSTIQCSPGCSYSWLGDKVCDNKCRSSACGFDFGDCPIDSSQVMMHHLPSSQYGIQHQLFFASHKLAEDSPASKASFISSFKSHDVSDKDNDDEWLMTKRQQRQVQFPLIAAIDYYTRAVYINVSMLIDSSYIKSIVGDYSPDIKQDFEFNDNCNATFSKVAVSDDGKHIISDSSLIKKSGVVISLFNYEELEFINLDQDIPIQYSTRVKLSCPDYFQSVYLIHRFSINILPVSLYLNENLSIPRNMTKINVDIISCSDGSNSAGVVSHHAIPYEFPNQNGIVFSANLTRVMPTTSTMVLKNPMIRIMAIIGNQDMMSVAEGPLIDFIKFQIIRQEFVLNHLLNSSQLTSGRIEQINSLHSSIVDDIVDYVELDQSSNCKLKFLSSANDYFVFFSKRNCFSFLVSLPDWHNTTNSWIHLKVLIDASSVLTAPQHCLHPSCLIDYNDDDGSHLCVITGFHWGGLSNRRRLTSSDTYAKSLTHVNRLFNSKFGVESRKVPAHMPHMIDKNIMNDLQSTWSKEWSLTSSNKFRDPSDMQYSFSYFHFLMNLHKLDKPSLLDKIKYDVDTNGNNLLDWNEFVSLSSITFKNSPTDHHMNEILKCFDLDKEKLIHVRNIWLNVSDVAVNGSLFDSLRSSSGKWFREVPLSPLVTSINCTILTNFYFNKTISLPRAVGKSDRNDVAFEMVTDDYNKTKSQLDSIRSRRCKFVCVNDDMDHPTVQVLKLLSDFYESFFPIPSQFELKDGLINDFLHLSDYMGHEKAKLVAFNQAFLKAEIALSVIAVIAIVIIAIKFK